MPERLKAIIIRLLLIGIIFIAILLRFVQLGHNPPSLTWDEAAWGYNAYAIGVDARDEFGKFLPVTYIESFGDFKPPMYMYLDVLPIKIFGLTEFATRFPSAFFGVLTVLVTYFLTKEVFFSSKYKEWIAALSSFVLAVSPWHVMLSRAAFEANVATFFLVCGIWFFLQSIHGKKWTLILSVISFVFSMYTFNTSRVVAPLILMMLTFIYWKKFLQGKRQLVISCLVGIILFAPLARFLVTPQAALRFQEVNIFTDPSVVQTANQEVANDHNAWWSKIIHNRRWLYTQSFLRHYFDNLNPNFLFITGDGNPKFSTQDVGELYLWDIPFFLIGILLLFRKKEGEWFLLPLWVVLGIIPAATARETPHALRIETILPVFQVLTAYGFFYTIQRVIKMKYKIAHMQVVYIIIPLVFLLLACNITYFLHGYYTHYPHEYSGEWQYGYKDSIAYVQKNSKHYNAIYVTEALGRPYIYYLFYTKTSPSIFRQQAVVHRDAFGFVDVVQFGKYYFSQSFSKIQKKGTSLFIATPVDVPHAAHVLQRFPLLNGNGALVAYTL